MGLTLTHKFGEAATYTGVFPEDFTDDLLWRGKMWVKISCFQLT